VCLLQRPRPRRWDRLLVLVLTVALVATLGTRALADPDDGEWLGAAPDPQTQPPQLQSATDAQQLAAGNPGSTPSNDTEVISDATSQVLTGEALTGEEQPKTPIAQGQTVSRDDVAEDTDQVDQDQQQGSPTGCTSGCSTEPPDPGTPTVRASA